MQALLLLLMAYAAVGLVLSVVVHLLALFGFQSGGPGGTILFFALHAGIFPLWIPVCLIAMKMMKGTRVGVGSWWGWSGSSGWSAWNHMLSGCPPWMKSMTIGFLIYAVVNFAIFFVLTAPRGRQISGEPPAAVWRGFSGHWMAFYSAGLAILTSAYRKGLSNLEPKCPNGHSIGIGDKFCPTCGTPIKDQQF
jgi:hypothetical protein